jgi:hypothetical protein
VTQTPTALVGLFHSNTALPWLLQNSCRPLMRTRFVPFSASRHFRAGLSYDAATAAWVS